MANDRILVSTEAMEQAINKYQNARNELQEAYENIDNAKKHLDNCYKGPAYLVLSAKLAEIYLNVKTAEIGLDESVRGLRQNITNWSTAENTNTQTSSSRDEGTAPAFL